MKRGISETISTLLVLIIVVSLGITVLSWGNQYISTIRQDIEYQSQVSQNAIKEKPVIEHVIINSTGAYIWVRNVGLSELVIDTIYIEKVSTGNITAIDLNVELDPGEATSPTQPIHIQQGSDYTFDAGETYIFTIVTKRGTQTSYTETY